MSALFGAAPRRSGILPRYRAGDGART